MTDTADKMPPAPPINEDVPVHSSGVAGEGADIEPSCLADVLPMAVGGTTDTSTADAARTRRQEMMSNTWEAIKSTSWRIFVVLQDVGEVVASVLGLNDSKFQYVIDNMSEEDWRVAREVNRRREAQLANKPLADAESGDSKEVVPVTDATEVER